MSGGLYFTIKNMKNWPQYLDDFWELHPSANKMGSLKELYKNDKTKGRKISSRKAWFCVLYCHPESDFYNLDHEEKMTDLAEDLFPSSASSKKMYEQLKPCIKYIEKAVLTKSHKHLVVLHTKLEERGFVYENNIYTLENADQLDKMLKSESTLMKAIQDCEDIIKDSSKDGSVKGGGELSLMEGGTLFS